MTSVDVTVRGARQRDALGHVRRPGARRARRADPDARARCTTSTATRPSTGSTRRRPGRGVDYPAEQFRTDANVLDGVELMGDGNVADLLWARPSATVLGIDVPAGDRVVVRGPGLGRARAVSLRLPPGIDRQRGAGRARRRTSQARVPWGLQCEIERVAVGDPFVGSLDGPAFDAMKAAMEEAFGHADDDRGPGRLDPALQRPRRDVSRTPRSCCSASRSRSA